MADKPQPTPKHTHTGGCYKTALTCNTMVHSHGNGCYKGDGTLKCSYSEHSHSGKCYEAVGPFCGHL